MSIKAMTWVWEHSPDKSTRLLLLLATADHCNDDGECYPSIKRLAAKCRTSVRRTQQVVESLKREGVLGVVIGGEINTNGGKTNRFYLNSYRISLGLQPIASTPLIQQPPAADCTPPPEEKCTTPPATEFTLTVSNNRQINHHPLNTHCWGRERIGAGDDHGPRVCEGESDSDEQAAFQWAAEHPFWSTRITDLAALRRNFIAGKAFHAQFVAARVTVCRDASLKLGWENDHAIHSSVTRSSDNPHTAFWQYFGAAARDTMLDPEKGH
ncbi:MAG: hypothetical protein R3F37_21140 [Candidatus Competibacteraceae bacterium]